MSPKGPGSLLVLFLVSWLAGCPLPEAVAADVQIIRISNEDRAAVIRTPEGRLFLITAGTRIPGVGRALEITEERIVIDASAGRGGETLIIRMESGGQRMERIRKGGDGPPLLFAPEGGRGP